MVTKEYFQHCYSNFDRIDPFFGSGLTQSLDRIPEADLHRRVGHRTIAQSLEHMLAWRYDLIKRLHDEPREPIELNSPRDWPDPQGRTKASYLTEFAATAERLKEGLAKFDESTLGDILNPNYNYTNVEVLEGGVQHDIYHLGQINLLAALLKNEG